MSTGPSDTALTRCQTSIAERQADCAAPRVSAPGAAQYASTAVTSPSAAVANCS